MLQNIVSVSSNSLATAESARYAALAVRLMYPRTHRDSRSRRSVRILPSPLGRFPVWTPATLDVAVSSLSAQAAVPFPQPRSRAALGLGHPSRPLKRECAPVDSESVSTTLTEPAAARTRATLGLGHPSSSPKSRVVSIAVVAAQTMQPSSSRAALGLRHPSPASTRLSMPLAPLCASPPPPSPRTRGRANIGIGHPSTFPRRPVAPVGPRARLSSSASCSYAYAAASQTPKPTTSRRVTPTSDSSRCAAKQSAGALPSISAPAQRSTSSGSPPAGTTQFLAGVGNGTKGKKEKGVEREAVRCGDVAMQKAGHLAMIGFKTLF
ncbi:hypothetical protein C8R47DRAFT_1190527 [Mycena vitilis]|nr:hypothetical protein C8R47DRAFT_1190527 [Mycena vitilis]